MSDPDKSAFTGVTTKVRVLEFIDEPLRVVRHGIGGFAITALIDAGFLEPYTVSILATSTT